MGNSNLNELRAAEDRVGLYANKAPESQIDGSVKSEAQHKQQEDAVDYGFPASWTKPMEDQTNEQEVLTANQTEDVVKAAPVVTEEVSKVAANTAVTVEKKLSNSDALSRKIIMESLNKPSRISETREYAPREDSPLYATEKMLFDAQRSIELSTELTEHGKIETQIAESVKVVGDLHFSGTGAAIAGEVEGNVVLDGNGVLYLTPTSLIKGGIKARNIIAEGTINGNVKCERLIATSTAVLMGDVEYKDVFNPAPGAKVEGRLCSNPNAFDSSEKPHLSAAAVNA